jgi:hypothetical protein
MKDSSPRLFLAVALGILAACGEAAPPPPPPGAIPAGESIGSAVVSGRVTLAGEIPPPEEINMASDPICAARGRGKVREEVVVGRDGSLENVFVHVVSGLGERVFAPPQTPVTLDQKGCAYSPHVVGLQVNQILEISNGDPTMHNVHTTPSENRAFNVGMATQGLRIRKHFSKPEVMIRLKCDLHAWMVAWIGVVGHPFFDVSGPGGGWSIEGLPSGTYTLEAWHEKFGTKRTEVTLQEGEQATAEFRIEP